MSDESSKTMMVDERQTVRQVLDSLLDKSHCGYSPDWSLVETITELQMGKGAINIVYGFASICARSIGSKFRGSRSIIHKVICNSHGSKRNLFSPVLHYLFSLLLFLRAYF